MYRARDTKLDRDVALKVLPEAFTQDPDRLARFEREAKVLASLNHPNIAAIYGLEEADGIRALVLELVEGPTLADRIKQGPIPLDEALPIAKQIAEALEAAHEKGVIHRDLKPANIKVRDDGTVKVLDFGLAKALDPSPTGDPSQSPTLTAMATQMGVIMGTAAYMSPEQARGKPVDKRADIWVFGAVLFEMLAGKRAFEGEDVSVTLADVIRAEPTWDRLPESVPPSLRIYLRRCLEKDPAERVQAIGDMRLAMKGAFEIAVRMEAPQPHLWWRPVPVVTATLMLLAVAALATWSLLRPAMTPAVAVTRFPFIPPNGDLIGAGDGMALSLDGTVLVYAGERDGVQQLFVRSRDQMTVRPLPGTEGGVYPFFSPDGAPLLASLQGTRSRGCPCGWTAYDIVSHLRELPGATQGATWGPDDTVVFGDGSSGALMQVSAAGGVPRPLTELGPDEISHTYPAFLPSGNAVIYTTGVSTTGVPVQVAVVSLETGEQRALVEGSFGLVAASGHLVFARTLSLWAVPFDADTLTMLGEPAPVIEGVHVNNVGRAYYALADDGTLVYLPAEGAALGRRALVWVDRATGQETPLDVPPRAYRYPRVSPDGTRVAVDALDQQQDTWIWDLSSKTLTRLTLDPGLELYGEWTPDGERVIFASAREGIADLFWRAADGTGLAEPLGESESMRVPQAVAPDGSVVLVRESSSPDFDLMTVSLSGDSRSETLLATEFNEWNPALSPDGRWFAYQSNASGVDEVYVRPFPDADSGLHQVSTDGGGRPLWAPDGRELFYENGGRLYAVPVQTDPTFTRGIPTVLIDGGYVLSDGGGRLYDIDPSGDRMLLIKDVSASDGDVPSTPSLTVVLNWFEELTRLVPTN